MTTLMPGGPADKAAVLGLVGLGVFYVAQEYRESCPDVSDLRTANGGADMLQHLIDGEAHTAIVVAGFALAASWVAGDLWPAALIVAVFGALCWYHHSVLAAPAVRPYK